MNECAARCIQAIPQKQANTAQTHTAYHIKLRNVQMYKSHRINKLLTLNKRN